MKDTLPYKQFRLPGYRLYVGDCLSAIKSTVSQINPSKTIVLADDQTEDLCLPLIQDAGVKVDSSIVIPSGEKYKSLDTCEKIWKRLFDLKADRHSLLVNLGGGVIGDMGGFCASTYMRGMTFVQIPTTLLAQVDASVGGKLGIDFYGLKNAVGLFRNPQSVWVDPVFLKSLPTRELRSGYAEVIKHGLIRDAKLWYQLTDRSDWTTQDWNSAITHSLKIKRKVVSEDPLETGLRKILNFGHTIGHAIESVKIDEGRPILHGEAIAAGMIAESYLSHHQSSLPLSDLEKISQYILSVYGKIDLHKIDQKRLLKKMKLDKKNEGTKINFSLLERIGHAEHNMTAQDALIRESLDYYTEL